MMPIGADDDVVMKMEMILMVLMMLMTTMMVMMLMMLMLMLMTSNRGLLIADKGD